MTSRERMLAAFRGERTDSIPVSPHAWGLYKFQLAGVVHGFEDEKRLDGMSAAELASVDALFYETFQPDMLHLGEHAPPRGGNLDEEKELLREIRRTFSLSAIERFVDLHSPSAEQVRADGRYDHVRILSRELGGSVFIAVNEGNPVCDVFDPHGILGFEEGLPALIESPQAVAALLNGLYGRRLDAMRVLKESGADAYIGSESYCSADLINPRVYRDVIFPAQRAFYSAVGQLGLVPITYFLGDIRPLVGDIGRLGVRGLMIEESKKGFTLDVAAVRSRLPAEIVLFGNLDSVHVLLPDAPAAVRAETARQIRRARGKAFVMANGSPIALNTPVENVGAMVDEARGTSGGAMRV